MTRRHSVMPLKKPITWFLVADGKQAQIYRHARMYRPLLIGAEKIQRELVPVLDNPLRADSIDEYDIGPEQLGRVIESKSSAHHASEPRTSVHQKIEQQFAQAVARKLHEADAQKAFDQLILIAPPKMLGELRKSLDRHVLAKVVAELAEELTGCNEHDLGKHLQKIYL